MMKKLAIPRCWMCGKVIEQDFNNHIKIRRRCRKHQQVTSVKKAFELGYKKGSKESKIGWDYNW